MGQFLAKGVGARIAVRASAAQMGEFVGRAADSGGSSFDAGEADGITFAQDEERGTVREQGSKTLLLTTQKGTSC
jgi:hypothetical protein